MNKYESVVIVDPACTEEKLKELQDKITGLINTNGNLESVEDMGKRKLAYPIAKCEDAHYVVYKFEAEPSSIRELERNYRIMDEVIRFVVINKSKKLK